MRWRVVVSNWIRGAMLIPALFALNVGAQEAKPFTNEQLDQMTAQIALYPDSLLAQLFMATTYPTDFAAAAGWSKAHPDAKGDDAVKLVENEPWDPSVASLAAFPEVLITLGDKPDWVRNMGDAFLAQPEDVMNSVQRLRAQAQKAGNLKTNEQIKVTSQAPEAAPATTVVVQQSAPPPQVIVIEPAQPQVVYVPAYNPAVVYGPWMYPAYPPYYYPPPPGYWFSRTVATGIAWGVAIGVNNALWGGCNWGRGDVNINVNRYNNINVNKKIDVNSNRTSWNHNPERRGSTPYRGGDNTRRNLEKKHDAGNREQYRGKDAGRDASRERASQTMQERGGGADKAPSRDASRERASQTMQDRGVSADKGGAKARATSAKADGGRDKATEANREAARQKTQGADREAAKQRSQKASSDNALKGANSTQARAQADRGAASARAAERSSGGAREKSGGGGGRSGGGEGGGRASGARRG